MIALKSVGSGQAPGSICGLWIRTMGFGRKLDIRNLCTVEGKDYWQPPSGTERDATKGVLNGSCLTCITYEHESIQFAEEVCHSVLVYAG